MASKKYRTRAGSIVHIDGSRTMVEFDWLEEAACFDCVVDPRPEIERSEPACSACIFDILRRRLAITRLINNQPPYGRRVSA